MKRSFFGVFVLGTILVAIMTTVAAEDSKDDAIQKERKRFHGTWRIMALEIDGNKSTEDDAKKFTVVNGEDGTWSLREDDKEVAKGTSTIDPRNKPKTIDFTITEGDGKGNQHLGIYEISENTRKLCFVGPGKDRPTTFTSMPGSEQILVTLEREKTK